MKIGDRVQVKPSAEGGARDPVMATVIYIHPLHRFYVAEFTVGGRKIRESFPFSHRRGQE